MQRPVLAVLLFSSIGLQKLVNPRLPRAFIDGATSGGALTTPVQIALAFMGVALLTQVLAAFAQYAGEDLGWAATNALRADMLLHVLGLDPRPGCHPREHHAVLDRPHHRVRRRVL